MAEQALTPDNYADSKNYRSWNWWNKLTALIALANILLALFNLSYIQLRDIYLHQLPAVVAYYDPVKGIEPHPDTQRYLFAVDTLTVQLPQVGLQAPQTEQLLSNLRQQSTDLLEENPFLVANKFGTFAKLKRHMQTYLGTDSARQAFARFWSQDFLAQVGWEQALSFFDSQIRPLLASNYYRYVDENGQFVDRFWQIDLYFIAFFGIEFLIQTFLVYQRHSELTWADAMWRRWYDGLLLLPTWRWLRIIPVLVRLHRSGLVNMQRVLGQMTHEPSAYLADRVSTFLMVRLINQTQDSIQQGDAARALLEPGGYVQVSDINKVDAITDRLLDLSIYKVLPQVQPDLEALLHHSLKGALQESDFYQQLKKVPGMKGLPVEVAEQFASYLAQATYEVLITSYSDLKGRQLFDYLTQHFKQALRRELQDEATQQELQLLLSDLLEEVKLNYVQRSTEQDPEATLEEADQLRQEMENPPPRQS
ncbi:MULTISPECIES: hypothetical protein [unclassified Coleofasciculus]|uniref:hypothetical protein n=1 Tax=unclassified Coleofasciculus TaxID=2692782 RepID=UPI00187EB947|nr:MULTISPECIES: hypothetical protein [unclassified Coleofasciculus]MBE9125678.1 hypothetical protein [Coleofasciculus sp. LEGE 07081]MBE9150816.1 hypothetical protein [Coleofasciculus sp. LEGE 07092]